jgi:hypothetical protein
MNCHSSTCHPAFLFILIRLCRAVPQSPAAVVGEPHSPSSTKSPSSGNIAAPDGGPSTGTRAGLAVGVVLGAALLGILVWLLIQCFPPRTRRSGQRPTELEDNQKPAELEGDIPAEWVAELCGRHTPVPIAYLIEGPENQCANDEKRPHSPRATTISESEPPTAPSGHPDPSKFLRESSIRLGESAMTPDASALHSSIPTPTAPSDVADPELGYLR